MKYIDTQNEMLDNTLTNKIFNEHFKSMNLNNENYYWKCLDCVIANLVFNTNYNRETAKQNPSTEYIKYPWFTSHILKTVFEVLVDNGYCFYKKGNYIERKPATYIASGKLLFPYTQIKRVNQDPIQMNKKKPYSKNKDVNIPVEPPKTSLYFKMRNDLEKINNMICNADIRFKFTNNNRNYLFKPKADVNIRNAVEVNLIGVTNYKDIECEKEQIWFKTIYGDIFYINTEYEFKIHRDALKYFRKFNRENYKYGGRFYTKIYTNLKSYIRKTTTINGNETTELDYAAIHISLLYNKFLKIEAPEFPYVYAKEDLDHKDERQINKYIVMIAINANSLEESFKAVKNEIRCDIESGDFRSKMPTDKELKQAFDNFLKFHKPIAKYIGSDIGIELQRIDSDIMNNVLVELADNKIIGLPIHDSIVVETKFIDIAKEIMNKQYLNNTKFNITITKE